MRFLCSIAGVLLVAFGLYIVICNWVRQYITFRNRHKLTAKWSSPAPFVGPLLILVGYALLPYECSKWMLLLFLADPDTVITVVSIPAALRKSRSSR